MLNEIAINFINKKINDETITKDFSSYMDGNKAKKISSFVDETAEIFSCDKRDVNKYIKDIVDKTIAKRALEKAERKRVASEAVGGEEKRHPFNSSDLKEILDNDSFKYTYNVNTFSWVNKDRLSNKDNYSADNTSEEDVVMELGGWIADNFASISFTASDNAINRECARLEKNVREEHTANCVKAIAYDPSCVEYLDSSLETIHSYFGIKEEMDVFKCIMKHWMMNTKVSFITNRERDNHVWINFYGAQGVGKSRFMQNFTNPIAVSRKSVVNVADLVDTQHNANMFRNAIITCDELGCKASNENERGCSLSNNEIAMLKSILTKNAIDFRTMYTQNHSTAKNCANIISTANQHLWDVIDDETGMRRFFEFTCQCENKSESEYAIINSIDWIKMWKGVDENEKYFVKESDVGKRIASIQETYFKLSQSVSDWLYDIVYGRKNGGWELTFNDYDMLDLDNQYDLYYEHMVDIGKRLYATQKNKLKASIERVMKNNQGIENRSLLNLVNVTDDLVIEAYQHINDNSPLGVVATIFCANYQRENGMEKFQEVVGEQPIQWIEM